MAMVRILRVWASLFQISCEIYTWQTLITIPTTLLYIPVQGGVNGYNELILLKENALYNRV